MFVQRLRQVLLGVYNIDYNESPVYLGSILKVNDIPYACRRYNILDQTKYNTVENWFTSVNYPVGEVGNDLNNELKAVVLG